MIEKFFAIFSTKKPLKLPKKVEQWFITLTVIITTLLVTIDISIVNVSIPAIQMSFKASINQLSAVVTFYIISSVITMPLTGYLSALWGRRQLFISSIILFTISSLFCSLAWNVSTLVIFRIFQGLGGGVLLPSAQAILLETFPKEEHGKAMGIFGLGVIVGPAIGSVLGAYLTDMYGWRSIFTVNLLPGILGTIMAFVFINNPSYLNKPKGQLDWQGLISLIIGLASCQYVLENSQLRDILNDNLLIFLIILGICSLVYFGKRSLENPQPIIDLSVFKVGNFTSGTILNFITGFNIYGLLFLLPIFMSKVLNFTTIQIGMVMMPGPLSIAIMMPIVGRLADRLNPRILLGLGITIFTVATWQLSYLTLDSGYWDLFWIQIERGIGLGLIFVPLSLITLGSISISKRISASGLYNLVGQLGGSFGIAILMLILHHLERVYMSLFNQSILTETLTQKVKILAYQDLFKYSAFIFVINYLPLWFLKSTKNSI